MRPPTPRLLAPRSWLRLPARTARLRLTLLYGALFLLLGAALLTVTYLLFERATGQQTGIVQSSAPRSAPALLVHQSLAPALRAAAAARNAADKHDLLIISGIALAIVLVLAVLLGWFFAGRMLRPVRAITATARRISANNLDERLALDDADEEFKQLGDTLDDLFGRLQAAFAAQQHFVANASHELRTPIAWEQTLLQVALTDPNASNAALREACEKVLAASKQQQGLVEALLTLATSERGLDHHEPVDLSVVADTMLLAPRPEAEQRQIEITAAIEPALTTGHPALIERLITNLIDNAVRYNTAGGHVHIQTDTTPNGHARLVVSNTGPEIPAGEIERLFEPFQRLTTRTNGHGGYGLGLSIVQAIATAHHAEITARPRPEGGLWIEVSFPQSAESSANTRGGGPHLQRQDDPRVAQDASLAGKRH